MDSVSRKVKIGTSTIGEHCPVYTIAEIGINHNGSLDNALNLIRNAKSAGFSAVKFQKRTVNQVYSEEELNQPRESIFGKTNGDLKRGLEFGKSDYTTIASLCKELDIDWFASPWDVQSVEFLEDFDVVAHKVASAKLTDKELLEAIRATQKPILLSTGMSDLRQVERAVEIIGTTKLILLHAVSIYPAKDEILNLSAIATLRKFFPEVPVGYSGHEVGILPSIIAVAKYGAVCVERHVTLDRSTWGTDQAASLELEGMVRLVRDINSIGKCEGDGQKTILDVERPVMQKLRKVDNIF